MRFFSLLIVIAIGLFVPRSALASRRVLMPVGYYAKQMDLAIVADLTKPNAPDYLYKLTVREVLQGKAQVGQTITIPNRMSSSEVLPYGDFTVAVLLKKNNAADGITWQVLEVYNSPQTIAALKLLLPVYRLPAEREQLLALQKLVRGAPELADSAMITGELAAAVSNMREPTNFDFIGSSLPLLNEAQRENFMTTLGTMNDLRAVPLLLAAMKDNSKKIRGTAAQTLTYRYPGALGVTEAMRAALNDESLKRTAQDYLSKRDAAVKVEWTPTPFHEAKVLFQSERKAEGVRALLSVMENKESGIFAGTNIISWTGEEILPFLDNEGKERLRALILRQAALPNNYLEAESLLKLIRQMPEMAFVPALQNLMHDMQPKSLYYKTNKSDILATFTLRNLGPRARELGAAQALKNLQQRLKMDNKPNAEEVQALLTQLAWLADTATWRSVPDSIGAEWSREWERVNLLHIALIGDNEAQGLIALLKNPPEEITSDMRDWVIYRLGDLGDRSAISFLLEELPKSVFFYPPAVKEALMQIGGKEVDEGALKLLRYQNIDVRRQAMEILRAVRGDKMRPLLRQILAEPDLGYKVDAAIMLGALGTPEDLPLLLPYADFWKADRSVQHWAASALASIRERFNYDVNGPIQKVG